MTILCYVIGVIMLVAFAGGGYMIADYLMGSSFIVNMFSLNMGTMILLTAVGAAIGLVFCLNWVVLGINCSSIKKLKRRKKRKHVEE